MFKQNKLTDFERLLFALKYIKDLLKEISFLKTKTGMMKSEIDELRDVKKMHKSELKKRDDKIIRIKKQININKKYRRVYNESIKHR